MIINRYTEIFILHSGQDTTISFMSMPLTKFNNISGKVLFTVPYLIIVELSIVMEHVIYGTI